MSLTKSCLVGAIALVAVAFSQLAEAAPAVWTVDSAQSYVRLNLPDQSITVEGISVTARVRNQSASNANTSSWTDVGGRRANVQGTFVTDVVGGVNPTSIQFLSGSHSLTAIETTAVRPDPQYWDEDTESYTNTSATVNAAYGGQLRAVQLGGLINVHAANFSISQVEYNIASGALDVVGNNLVGASDFGLSNGLFAVLGASPLGITIPSLLEPVPAFGGANVASATILDLGGGLFQMTYSINVPIAIEIEEGLAVTGSATGVIVATADLTPIPEPASLALAAIGALTIAGCVIRRRRA